MARWCWSQDATPRVWLSVGERNGYLESFNGKLRDERELFYTLLEVQVLTEQYRHTYNRIRPHSSWGYRPPASETVLSADAIQASVGLT